MFTDQETRIAIGLAICAGLLGMIYLAAWLSERFHKTKAEQPLRVFRKDLPGEVSDEEFEWIKIVVAESLSYTNTLNETILDAYKYVIGFRKKRNAK